MMKIRHIFLALMGVILMISCGGKQQQQEDTALISGYEKTDDQIHRMVDYDHTDTIEAGSHTYLSNIHAQADDSLAVVKDETGVRYADNYYQLTITRDGAGFFSHRFTKKAFEQYLDKGFRRYGILDGFRYTHGQGGTLYFSACVSYPESDMSSPFVVAVGPDGSYAISVDDSLNGDEDE